MKGIVIKSGDIERVNKNFCVDDSTPIMRYMDFSKYMSLLETRKLFFCEAKKFEDIHEGAIPRSFLEIWPSDERETVENIQRKINNTVSTYISCWNQGFSESYAMWKIYTEPKTGVCVRSTVGSLKRSLNAENLSIYKVKYIDINTDNSAEHAIPIAYFDTSTGPFPKYITHAYKKLEYEYENEIRAVILREEQKQGMDVDVNLDMLIQEVFISPYAPEWFDQLVRKVTVKYLKDKIDIFRSSNIGLRR